jgi:hypothetical protein
VSVAERGTEAQSDFAVTLKAPKETSVGGRATFAMEITNEGPDASEAKLRFNKGRGATAADFDAGETLRTVSQTASKGDCNTDPAGVICRPGTVPVGETVKVEVVVKIFDAYIPRLGVQATVAPEFDPRTDPDNANDHAEARTAVRAPIVVDGLPEGCATRPFILSVRTDVPKAKRTKALVDGKVLDTSAAASWTVKVKPGELDKGSHRLAIVVQGGHGSLAKLTRKFKTC